MPALHGKVLRRSSSTTSQLLSFTDLPPGLEDQRYCTKSGTLDLLHKRLGYACAVTRKVWSFEAPVFRPGLYSFHDSVRGCIFDQGIYPHFTKKTLCSLSFKLLLSLPAHLREQFEGPSLEGIRKTAQIFEGQCVTEKTACALSARFLSNVVVQYENVKRKAVTASAPLSKKGYGAGATSRQHNPNTTHSRQHISFDIDISHGQSDAIPESHSSINVDMTSGAPNYGTAANEGMFVPVDYQPDLGNWTFENEDMWQELFASAGYRINEGIFIQDATM